MRPRLSVSSMSRVFAVCGMPGSGKGEFAQIFIDSGIPVRSMGDMVREEVARRELDVVPEVFGKPRRGRARRRFIRNPSRRRAFGRGVRSGAGDDRAVGADARRAAPRVERERERERERRRIRRRRVDTKNRKEKGTTFLVVRRLRRVL